MLCFMGRVNRSIRIYCPEAFSNRYARGRRSLMSMVFALWFRGFGEVGRFKTYAVILCNLLSDESIWILPLREIGFSEA